MGTFLVVQWLRHPTLHAGGLGSILGQGTRSPMLQPRVHTEQQKILHGEIKTLCAAAAKTQCSQINKIKQ